MRSYKFVWIFVLLMFMLVPNLVFADDDTSAINYRYFINPTFAVSDYVSRYFTGKFTIDTHTLYNNCYMWACSDGNKFSLGEDELRYKYQICQALKATTWVEYNRTEGLICQDYIDGKKGVSIYSISTSGTRSSTDVCEDHCQAEAKYKASKTAILNNITSIWLAIKQLFGMLFSVLVLMFVVIELVFFTWIFLDFIPKQILKFRNFIKDYFLGKL